MKIDNKIINHFISEEGFVLEKYYDTEGFPTIGIGHKLRADEINIQKITSQQAYDLLQKDIQVALNGCYAIFQDFDTFPENTKLGILDMIFNLGLTGFSKFQKTIGLIKSRKFYEASLEALDSKWARFDVPNRAKRTAKLLAG